MKVLHFGNKLPVRKCVSFFKDGASNSLPASRHLGGQY